MGSNHHLLLSRKILRRSKLGGGGKRSRGFYSYAVYILEPPSFSFMRSDGSTDDPMRGSVPLSQALNWDALPGHEEFSADRSQSVKTVSCDVEVWRMNEATTTYLPWYPQEDQSQEVTRIRAAGQDIEAHNHPDFQSRFAAARAAECFGMAIVFGLPLFLSLVVRVLPIKARTVLWVVYGVCGLAFLLVSGIYLDTHFK